MVTSIPLIVGLLANFFLGVSASAEPTNAAAGQNARVGVVLGQNPPGLSADLDNDGDVDIDDLTLFVACVTGPMIPYDGANLPPGCTLPRDAQNRIAADLDNDGDVDQADFGLFQMQFIGSSPADPGCGSPAGVRTTVIPPTDGTLTRGSTAYFPSEDRRSLDDYAADTRRIGRVLAVSPSDGVVRTTDALMDGSTVDGLIVGTVTGGYLWGYRYGKPQLYRSADGDHWEVAQTFSNSISAVWAVHQDDHPIVQVSNPIFEMNRSVVVARCKVWYWSGDRWTEASYQVPEGDNWISWSDGVGEPRQATWSMGFAQAPHGTLLLNGAGSLYGGSAEAAIAGYHAQEIWRSVDRGRSWRRVLRWDYALKDADGNYLWPAITHMHAMGYHAGTHRWIVDTGDVVRIDPRTSTMKNRKYWMVSDDDGLTWKDHLTGGPYPVSESHQIAHWFDYGDPEQLAIASDWMHRVSTVSMLTFEVTQLLDPRPEFYDDDYPYLTTVTRHNGWWLALSANTTTTGKDTQAIWVSPDSVHWAVYHEFGLAAGITTVAHFAGEINGKLHMVLYMTDGQYRHFVVSPPRGRVVDAVVVSPARVNLLGPVESQCETESGLSTGTGTTAMVVATPRMSGAGALRLVRTGGDSSLQLYPVKTEQGKSYQASVWLRGGHNLKRALVRFPSDQPAGQVHVGLSKDQWVRAVTGVWTETAPGGAKRMLKVMGSGVTPDESELFVDGCEIAEAKQAGPWQQGGTPQTAEVLTRDVTLCGDWTYVLGLYSFGSSGEFAPNTTYEIARFNEGHTGYIKLIYDTAELKFKLVARRAGDLPETIVGTKANWFHRGSTFRFIVRHTATGRIQATLLGAKGVEEFCDLPENAPRPIRRANQVMLGASEPQFSGMIFGEEWTNAAWTDAEQDAYIAGDP